MIGWRAGCFRALGLSFVALLLSACASSPPTSSATAPASGARQSGATPVLPKASSVPGHFTFSAPAAWGGEVRCTAVGCRLVLVEHEENQMVLHAIDGKKAVELDRQQVAYHPDSAKWLTDTWAVAAVERGQSLDIFSTEKGRLKKETQLKLPFAPRDVLVLSRHNDQFTLLAAPYSGTQVAVVNWALGATEAKVTSLEWCDTPWHPALVDRAPKGRGKGVVVACLDGKRLIYADANNWAAKPVELAKFDQVARQASVSPSGKWVYVALELGGKNARVDMDSGEIQYLVGNPAGSVSVAPLSDDTVIWGDSNNLYLQRFDAAGAVLETRYLPASGFPTQLQLIDVNGDGERDLVILNSAGERADVYLGPVWDRAMEKL